VRAATSERARAGVISAIRQAITRIAESHRQLGHHLDRTIHTGTYCAYRPDPAPPLVEDLSHSQTVGNARMHGGNRIVRHSGSTCTAATNGPTRQGWLDPGWAQTHLDI
jgi:hypothetical protein